MARGDRAGDLGAGPDLRRHGADRVGGAGRPPDGPLRGDLERGGEQDLPVRQRHPEPVDLHHWEAYLFSDYDRTGIASATQGPALEVNWGAVRDLQLHLVIPAAAFIPAGSPTAFGHYGAGGSGGFADHERGIGFGYVMNKMGFHLVSDPREVALRNALFRDTLGTRPQA